MNDNRVVTSAAFRRFHNALRIMRAIDEFEVPLISDWAAFRDDPYRYFIGASEQDAEMIWLAIERRQPRRIEEAQP
jgi:hypothetical protein